MEVLISSISCADTDTSLGALCFYLLPFLFLNNVTFSEAGPRMGKR